MSSSAPSCANNSKAELIAIYRLEFYKKKKNWKFCAEDKEKSNEERPVESTKILNKTFNVENGENVEKSPPVEHTVLETISSKETPPATSNSHLSDTRRDDLWVPFKNTDDEGAGQGKRVRAEIEKYRAKDIRLWSEFDKWAVWEKVPSNLVDPNEGQAEVSHDCPTVHVNWPEDSNMAAVKRWAETENGFNSIIEENIRLENENGQMWNEFAQEYPEAGRRRPPTPPPDDAWPDEEIREAASVLLAAEASVSPADLPSSLQYRRERPLAEYAEFARAAHRAPHSSQLELRFHTVPDPSQPTWLTTAQLRRRVAALAAVLRDLLQQLRERESEAPPAAACEQPCDLTTEERPTRDTGPSAPDHTVHSRLKRELMYQMQDDFLAGSFMQAPEGFLEDSFTSLQEYMQVPQENGGCFGIDAMDCFMGRDPVAETGAGEGRYLQSHGVYEVNESHGRGRGRVRSSIIGIGNGRPYRL
ncbi:uncharacterized protein LOC128202096 [Galleria mellonella]|uniref:Uncharacterized protein LOC128202096 n=1 Tax=Galleria mellonella TaxID=7137 RepID=A0ABM3N0K0_GALME|nr:uncharacterized protein LOC128202096 [Galleria mellonella]